jgi:hypothetical protein
MGAEIFAGFFILMLLVHLGTGVVTMRHGGSIRRSEQPGEYWGCILWEYLLIAIIIFTILNKPDPRQISEKMVLEAVGGFICSLIVAHFFHRGWKPCRREVFGVGWPRTVILYVACVLSAPVILIWSLRSNLHLGFLFFVSFLILILGTISAQKDSGQ